MNKLVYVTAYNFVSAVEEARKMPFSILSTGIKFTQYEASQARDHFNRIPDQFNIKCICEANLLVRPLVEPQRVRGNNRNRRNNEGIYNNINRFNDDNIVNDYIDESKQSDNKKHEDDDSIILRQIGIDDRNINFKKTYVHGKKLSKEYQPMMYGYLTPGKYTKFKVGNYYYDRIAITITHPREAGVLWIPKYHPNITDFKDLETGLVVQHWRKMWSIKLQQWIVLDAKKVDNASFTYTTKENVMKNCRYPRPHEDY